jgi:hypothetical protein
LFATIVILPPFGPVSSRTVRAAVSSSALSAGSDDDEEDDAAAALSDGAALSDDSDDDSSVEASAGAAASLSVSRLRARAATAVSDARLAFRCASRTHARPCAALPPALARAHADAHEAHSRTATAWVASRATASSSATSQAFLILLKHTNASRSAPRFA